MFLSLQYCLLNCVELVLIPLKECLVEFASEVVCSEVFIVKSFYLQSLFLSSLSSTLDAFKIFSSF